MAAASAQLTPPENFNVNATDQASEWDQWFLSYEVFETATSLKKEDDCVRRATLLHCLGPQVQRIFKSLPGDKGTFDQTKKLLNGYFQPKKNIVAERYKFRQRAQKPNENMDQYVIGLRDLVRSCDFGNLENDLLRDQIVEKCVSNQLREKLLSQENDKLIETIEQVFERCRERHVVLNPKKVKLGLREIDVVGHNFTDKGVKPSKSKVSAIIDAPAPTNVNELRSFLGTVGYVHKFILDYARICEPLRKLLRNDVEWKWESAQENAFSELKNEISKHPCLAYYKLGAPTTVIVDGSPVGVGAVLLQKQGDNSLKPVAYASRSLTATERRYSQVEREALACVWAVEYFRNYLGGVNFQILTDHRPLIYMFNPKVSTIVPPRIERLLWKLQAYDYTIEHIPGKENIADSLSRMPVQTIHDERHDSFVDDYILNIIDICFNSDDILSENAITLDELKLETTNDETLCKLHGYICAEWPKVLEPEIQPFYKYRNELSTFDSLILRGHRIVVPPVLKDRVLNLAHETHPGIVRTKVFLRMRYFWPGLDSEVEQVVLNCKECTINQPLVHDTPLQPVELPDKPWQKLAIDVFGPIKGDYLLTVMDYHSSWPEAIILPDIRSESIILGLADIFSRFGFPGSCQ